MLNSIDVPKQKIAIIGAGLAGLTCATELQALGFIVEVFEKSRGASGRMSTRRSANWEADHGAQYFTARDPAFIQTVASWMDQKQVALWAPNLKVFEDKHWRASQSRDQRYVATPGMSSLGKHLAKRLPIQFEQTISQIERVGSTWVLHSSEAGRMDTAYDGLVLAIPSPQALVLVKEVDSRASALAAASNMNACWTLMIKFVTQPAFDLDAGFVNNEIISWVCRNNSKPERVGDEYWVVHANPQWSQTFVELSKEDATAQMVACLAQLGFNCKDAAITTHRWRYASGSLAAPPECYLSGEIKLGLCGDWLHGGRIEGAWLSGHKLATRLSALFPLV